MKRLLTAAAIVALLSLASLAPGRTWTSRDGKFTSEATFLGCQDGQVRLQKASGSVINVPLEKLSDQDQRWVRDELRRRSAEGEPKQPVQPESAQPPKPAPDEDEEITEALGLQRVDLKLVPLEMGGGKRKRPPSALATYALMMTSPQVFFMQIDRLRNAQQERFARVVAKEPAYASTTPFRAVAKLGSGEYGLALDAVGKEPIGYNRLYADVNHDGDLTNDPPIDAADVQATAAEARVVVSSFPLVKLKIDVDGTKVDYVFVLSVTCQRAAATAFASATLYAGAIREGELLQGQKKIRLVLVDRNSNGRFDDRVSIQSSGAGLQIDQGDLLLVNPNTKNRLSSDATIGRDRYFVGPTVCLGKRFYKLHVAPSGEQVRLEPTELAIGYVTNASPAYRAVVYSDECGALVIGGTRGQRIPLPAGPWKVASYTIDATGFTGGSRTAVTALFSGDAKPVAVAKGQTADLAFGGPFHPVVTSSRAADGKVSLSLSIVGVGGERCTSFFVNGRRPPEPRFEIRDKDEKAIYQGKFEYG